MYNNDTYSIMKNRIMQYNTIYIQLKQHVKNYTIQYNIITNKIIQTIQHKKTT